MELKLDLTKEYGIVLEGGGAKGAYQIGAWKALKEAGVRIRGVSGVSVGALNGALICMGDLERAEKLWGSIRYSRIMDVDDNLFERVLNLDLKNLELGELFRDAGRILKDRGLDVTPLKNLIDEMVDEETIRESGCQLFVTTFSLSDRKLIQVDVSRMQKAKMKELLLASAYLPVFKSEKLGGKSYTDGGGFDNVPLDVLVGEGYQDIIVIRIYGPGKDRERKVVIPEGTHIHRIAPNEDLGGILTFDRKMMRRNMMLGYLGAKRMMYGLMGRHYFIDAPHSETYYLDRLLAEARLLLEFLAPEIWAGAGEPGCRAYTERIFPEMARKLRLKPGWGYRELYVAALEELALLLKISRYRIYQTDGLLLKIRREMAKQAGISPIVKL